MTTTINVSLEQHLLQALTPLTAVLPPELSETLAKYITDPPSPHIPYDLLLDISKWSRTAEGSNSLNSRSLNPHDYNMVSLLAGSLTSPDRTLGDYIPPKDPEEVEAHRARERKQITALVNGLLSVGCVGFAAWWVADRSGWKNEWRVLFALFAALVVAVAEGGLFLIYQTRQSQQTHRPLKITGSTRHKKRDLPAELPDVISNESVATGIDSTHNDNNLTHRQ
ncbi:hypothetical protein CVT24_006257 [Panaeolus cyanescens]|uniref:Endoplasmic reticulum-based factor for assembly of V-ATPase n=1 Tax=Panaeolus cyanescens TaxID=181874 RepID=A0A409VAK5_9AGAR|nr:hypothetical protein CVT24_006257 [Panaeolus cyanescens]